MSVRGSLSRDVMSSVIKKHLFKLLHQRCVYITDTRFSSDGVFVFLTWVDLSLTSN